MKRIYISGPITGVPDYRERFKKAENKLIGEGLAPINPAEVLSPLPEDTTPQEYMDCCVPLIHMSDAIYMLKGWEDSKGAKMERVIASRWKLPTFYEGGPL